MNIAEQINQLPFYQACREADQLCVRSKKIEDDTIWKFADGSQLTSYAFENKTEVLK
jgi:hypothetical protein